MRGSHIVIISQINQLLIKYLLKICLKFIYKLYINNMKNEYLIILGVLAIVSLVICCFICTLTYDNYDNKCESFGGRGGRGGGRGPGGWNRGYGGWYGQGWRNNYLLPYYNYGSYYPYAYYDYVPYSQDPLRIEIPVSIDIKDNTTPSPTPTLR